MAADLRPMWAHEPVALGSQHSRLFATASTHSHEEVAVGAGVLGSVHSMLVAATEVQARTASVESLQEVGAVVKKMSLSRPYVLVALGAVLEVAAAAEP